MYLLAGVASSGPYLVRTDLRTDGVPTILNYNLSRYQALLKDGDTYPFKPFSAAYVKKALADPVDWVAKGAVTPAKDQGPHGYCGTFGRTVAAEGGYALRSGHGLKSFSEEELVDCIGWDEDQFSYVHPHGFMSTDDYPYNESCSSPSCCTDPPVPNNPCQYKKSAALPGTADHAFTNTTAVPGGDEEQLAAFVHHNGPTNTGIASHVFGLREKGCEKSGDCFITKDMCEKVKGMNIDHSIAIVGYGTDAKHGDYWAGVATRTSRALTTRRVASARVPHARLARAADQELLVQGLRQRRVHQDGTGRLLRPHRLLRLHIHVWRPGGLLRVTGSTQSSHSSYRHWPAWCTARPPGRAGVVVDRRRSSMYVCMYY